MSCYTGDMETHPMLTVKQVAAQLQIGEVTVLRWLRSGKLAGVKPGGTRIGWRIPPAEIARLLRSTRP
jgi:excisionase family DNA binding protein